MVVIMMMTIVDHDVDAGGNANYVVVHVDDHVAVHDDVNVDDDIIYT